MMTGLDTGRIFPLVIRLIVPAVIAKLITFLYNIVDRMYVSRMQGSGMDALAALGIVLPITLIIQAFADLVGLGGSPRAGIRLGEGNEKEANRIFNLSFLMLVLSGCVIGIITFFFAEPIVLLFGCPLSALGYATSYLKIYSCGTVFIMLAQGMNPFVLTQGYSFLSMCFVLMGTVLNIVMDPLFIFNFGMGVQGSALATVLAQFLSAVCTVGFFFSAERFVSIVSLGITPFVMTITECAIQIVFNINLNLATGGNKDYTAALTVMLSALQLISLPLNGMGNGMQPFVSYNYGKGNTKRLKQGITYVTMIAFLFAAIVWSISLMIPQMYAHLFAASESVTVIVEKYCPMFLMGSIMFFVQMTLQNINIALGQGRTALLLAVNRKVILLIPMCFLLTKLIGFKGVYLSEGITDFVAGIITAIVIFSSYPRVFRRREEELANAENREKK